MDVQLRGSGTAVVRVPLPLEAGQTLVLQPLSERDSRYASIQLFGRVGKAGKKPGIYLVAWERTVCPQGAVPMVEFLQSWLGVNLHGGEVDLLDFPDAGLVIYRFDTGEFSIPALGQTYRAEISQSMRDEPDVHSSHEPDSPSRFPAAPEPEQEPASEYRESDEVMSIHGIKISKSDWEKLDHVGVKVSQSDGTYRVPEAVRREMLEREAARSQQDQTKAQGGEHGSKKAGKLGGLLRKVATLLGDKDEK